MTFYRFVASQMPELELKLRKARLTDTSEYYVKKTFFSSFVLSIGIILILFFFFQSLLVILSFPIFILLFFFYLIHYVDMHILKLSRAVTQEIVFAGRFLIIELESGVPMFNAFEHVGNEYPVVGLYFHEIIEKTELGTTLEEAMNETLVIVPCEELRKIFWQILTSLSTGADVIHSLNNVLDHIVREQRILVTAYGRKLSPLAMFYMMIAIIVPSLGMIMVIVMATFIGLNLDLTALLAIAGGIGFIQFMFLSTVKSSRPPIDL